MQEQFRRSLFLSGAPQLLPPEVARERQWTLAHEPELVLVLFQAPDMMKVELLTVWTARLSEPQPEVLAAPSSAAPGY